MHIIIYLNLHDYYYLYYTALRITDNKHSFSELTFCPAIKDQISITQ